MATAPAEIAEKPEVQQKLESAILSVIDRLEEPDKTTRLNQLGIWRKNDMMWRGVPDAWWNKEISAWQTAADAQLGVKAGADFDPSMFDKSINIIKPHGESVIAALSASVPFTRWYPADSDNPDDIMTAKAYSKGAKKIQRDNVVILQFIRMFLYLWKYGFAAVHNQYVSDPTLGSFQRKDIKLETVDKTKQVCPDCGLDLGEPEPGPEPVGSSSGEGLGQAPLNLGAPPPVGPPTAALPPAGGMGGGAPLSVPCPQCGVNVQPEMHDYQDVKPSLFNEETVERGKLDITVYSPLNVRVPYYIQKLKDAPYLTFSAEYHYSIIRNLYKEKASEIGPMTMDDQGTLDRIARMARAEFTTADARDLVTLNRTWLRPSAYYVLDSTDPGLEQLTTTYPQGLCITYTGDKKILEIYEEKLDDVWTLTESPLAEFIHADPIGDGLISIQEFLTELISLTMQTIEYSIADTWADPSVVDFKAYKKSRKAPGNVYPIKSRRPNENLSQAFHQNQGATLSKDVDAFRQYLENMAQFEVGDYPSIYGGPLEGGSNTAYEYQESRNQALQRLSTHWKTANQTWSNVMDKSTRMYFKYFTEDQKFSEKFGAGYLNIWIRKEELRGKIGSVESDSSDKLPVTWQQKQDRLMYFIGLNNPIINEAIFHSENSGRVASLFGFEDFYIPGEQDRDKQLWEISEMLRATPVMDPFGMTPPMPSVEIEADIDDHQVHIDAIKGWANSEMGRQVKSENPAGYQNVILHLQQHLQAQMAQMQAAPVGLPGGAGGPGGPGGGGGAPEPPPNPQVNLGG